jgi:hypothetical protein
MDDRPREFWRILSWESPYPYSDATRFENDVRRVSRWKWATIREMGRWGSRGIYRLTIDVPR